MCTPSWPWKSTENVISRSEKKSETYNAHPSYRIYVKSSTLYIGHYGIQLTCLEHVECYLTLIYGDFLKLWFPQQIALYQPLEHLLFHIMIEQHKCLCNIHCQTPANTTKKTNIISKMSIKYSEFKMKKKKTPLFHPVKITRGSVGWTCQTNQKQELHTAAMFVNILGRNEHSL